MIYIERFTGRCKSDLRIFAFIFDNRLSVIGLSRIQKIINGKSERNTYDNNKGE